jgi:hypothetical protein
LSIAHSVKLDSLCSTALVLVRSAVDRVSAGAPIRYPYPYP